MEFKFNCEKCDYHTDTLKNYTRHKKTTKHKKNYEIEIQNEKIENQKKKYTCDLCEFYTDNSKCYSQHKRTNKHLNNIEKSNNKINDSYGLIYLIRLSTFHKKDNILKSIYKFGFSKKNNLNRLKCYNGINKIEKELMCISVSLPKKCENYIKDELKENIYYEKCLSNSGEYFIFNFIDNNDIKNDNKLIKIFNNIINNYNNKNKNFLKISEFNNISLNIKN